MNLEERLESSLKTFAVNTGAVMGILAFLGIGVGLISKIAGYEDTENYTHIGMMLRCALSATLEKPMVYIPLGWGALTGLGKFLNNKNQEEINQESYEESQKEKTTSLEYKSDSPTGKCIGAFSFCAYRNNEDCNHQAYNGSICPLERDMPDE